MRKLLTPRNLIVIIVILVLMFGSAALLRIPLPTIVLAAERVFSIGGFSVTNTALATVLADITVIVLAWLATRRMKEIPEGLQNIVEWFVEAFHGLNVDVAGKVNAGKFFPIFMTYLIFLMIANWYELVPGFDTVGRLEPLEVAYQEAGVSSGYEVNTFLGIPTLTASGVKLTEEQKQAIEQAEAEGEAHGEESDESAVGGYVLVPYLRTATTDLNLPLALALISVVWTQVVGVQTLGLGYFRKFIVPPMTGMKVVDAFVGLLELVSELAKIISFTFRLFGNIFAGTVLLVVMIFLIPFFVPLPFYGLEVFVGFMQAFVFAILTLIFMTMATISHAEDHH